MTKVNQGVNERELVYSILLAVSRDNVKSHIALQDVLGKYQYIEKNRRAFITRLTEGTLERQVELDYILQQFSTVPVKKMKPPIRVILEMAVYQLLYMDAVPDAAVCNEAVLLAKAHGFRKLSGFVNGVLRNISRKKEAIVYPSRENAVAYLSVRYSMPEWIVKKWLSTYDVDVVETILKGFLEEKPMSVRFAPDKISQRELIERLAEEGVKAKPHPYLTYALLLEQVDYLLGLPSFLEGLFQVQDVSSMLVGEVATIKKENRVLDVCAAPGGKALHVAQKMEGTGTVIARDVTPYKTDLIKENQKRLGISNMKVEVHDARVLDESLVGQMDVVLCDLPCSGLGVLGKKTDLKYKTTQEGMDSLVKLQREILLVASKYVREGGYLIYSTCTIHQAENEDNGEWFLQQCPQFSPASIKEQMPEMLKKDVRGHQIQLLPGVHQCDGFYIAKFQRNEGEQ